jgi:hypothetical protein
VPKRGRRGGAGTAGGINFQYGATAWTAVAILAETAATPPWGFSAGTTLDEFWSESDNPVDDLAVVTSSGRAFCQIKATVTASTADDSDLASALGQFVRQLRPIDPATKGDPFNPARDRLVLIVGAGGSSRITEDLSAIIQRLRDDRGAKDLNAYAVTQTQLTILGTVLAHIEREWHTHVGSPPTVDDVKQLLALVWIDVLDGRTGGSLETQAKDRLRTAILADAQQADAAWAVLLRTAADAASLKSGLGRASLQQRLLDADIRLRPTHSYISDAERLRLVSQRTCDLLDDLSVLTIAGKRIKVARDSSVALRAFAEDGSLLLVGQAGDGKTASLYDLVTTLRNDGRDVVFLAVGDVTAHSLGELREQLDLRHDLLDTLANWPGTEPAFFVIDALDAARADAGAYALRQLIRLILQQCPRWRVIASIRKFDLRYGHELKAIFQGAPHPRYSDAEFAHVRHLNIPAFSEAELQEIARLEPRIARLLSAASDQLNQLLRSPFNLRIAAELLGEGVVVDSIAPLKSQLELLDRYWQHRVIRSDGRGDAREIVISHACEQMVSSRSLQASRLKLTGPDPDSVPQLLSAHVFREWQSAPDAAVERYVVTFSHHILLDYAIARVLLRGDPRGFVGRLASDREFIVFARPSVGFHFQHLWTSEPQGSQHRQFWKATFDVQATSAVPELAKLVGPTVAVDLATSVEEFRPLLDGLQDPTDGTRVIGAQALAYVVGAIMTLKRIRGSLPMLPWADLLESVTQSLTPQSAYPARALLLALCGK